MNLAPIVLFVYNRPSHTQQTLEALANNDLASETVLYIFADGPKDNATKENLKKIRETREIIKSKQWCREVIISEKEKNFGLADSIISGVTEVVNKHGKIIVLEDDIIVSPYFLQYMNDGLTIYENEPKVVSIHAYNYPIDSEGLPDTFFMKGADCWGWGTWTNEWNLFEKDAEILLNKIEHKNLQFEFDIQDNYPYTKMLKDQTENKVDSWAICWYASAFLNNKYTIYPKKSLIYNIGFDNSGIHTGSIDNFNNKNWNNKSHVVIKYEKNIETNRLALERWKKHLGDIYKPEYSKKVLTFSNRFSIIGRIYNRIKRQIRST